MYDPWDDPPSIVSRLNRCNSRSWRGWDGNHLIPNRLRARFGKANFMHGTSIFTKAFTGAFNDNFKHPQECRSVTGTLTVKQCRIYSLANIEETKLKNMKITVWFCLNIECPLKPMVFHGFLSSAPFNLFFFEAHPSVTPWIPTKQTLFVLWLIWLQEFDKP